MEKNFEINQAGQNIRCKLYCEKKTDIQKVVLFVHGFAGHKDTATARKFADRVLTKYKGIAVVTFNLPCHGDDVKKKLQLSDCLNYLHLVLDYIREELGTSEIYAYTVSFGGYLCLKYLHEFGNPFVRLVLRSPALDMPESLYETVMKPDEREELLKGKPVSVGFDRKVEITKAFLEELKESDVRKMEFLDFADDLLLIHGTADEVVPFEVSKAFSENNVIELVPIPGADHRFSHPDHLEAATKQILSFFEF